MDTAVPDEFHGNETLLTSHETPSFFLLAMSAKLMIFNIMKLSMKPPLRLECIPHQYYRISFASSLYKDVQPS